jgi:hypothetical protein
MVIAEWFVQNWFNFISLVVITTGLWFTAISVRSETKTRRVANLLTITANDREIWKVFLGDKDLARVRSATVDTIKQPITDAERVFVTFVILHMSSTFYAMSDQLVINVEGLRRDIAQFLSLPIPKEVWDKIKVLQNDDFVAFVESCRNWK